MAELIGVHLGQYEIVAFLGKGGMATVYRARQLNIEREVAIKVIKPDLAEAADFVERFKREAKTIALLSHPHILKLFDYGQHGDLIYVVMELQTGGSLADQIRQGPLPLVQATRVLDQIASALDYAHAHGVIHRDLKPQNVLLDSEGNAQLTDFGIAKLITETSALTQSGVAMGTPTYMSPEQWRGLPLDSRADIYALGIVLFEMLTGQAPFKGDTPFSMMHAHVYEPPPAISDLRADLPPSIERVIAKALAKDRDQRFSSAGRLAEAFKDALVGHVPVVTSAHPQMGEPTQVDAPPSPPDSQLTNKSPLPTTRRRGCMPLVLALGSIVVLLLIGAISIFILSSQPDQTITSVAIQVTTLAPVEGSTNTSDTTPLASTTSESSGPTPTGRALSATDVESTIQAAINLQLTANALPTAQALTATATLWTPTPTLDIMGTVNARLTATQRAISQPATMNAQPSQTKIATATVRAATPSPTPTNTPKPPTATYTLTSTLAPKLPTVTYTLTPTFTLKPPTTTATPAPTQAQGVLDIFSFWSGGSDAQALAALVKLYNQKYPLVRVMNSNQGSGWIDSIPMLHTRLLGGSAPDVLQTHAGQELLTEWVINNQLTPLTGLFKEAGWTDKFPKYLIDLVSYRGEIWAVPAIIHRSNVMWFVPDNLRQWGVDVPATWDDFFRVCGILKGKNVIPLALGPNWTATEVFENVLLAQLGPEGYRALWAGDLKWTDPRVKDAWATFGRILDCANNDGNALGDWVPAMEMVLSGKAAFQVMGDWWSVFVIQNKGLTPGKDFGWAPAPGTAEAFNVISDIFTLPKNAPHPDNALRLLMLVGSIEGQDAVNPAKGSIPARPDVDVGVPPGLYNAYQQSAVEDYRHAVLVGSLIAGTAAPLEFVNDFPGIMEAFIRDRHVDAAALATQQLADRVKIAK